MNHTDVNSAGNTCPSAETLTAYLAATHSLPAEVAAEWDGVMQEDETRQITAHLATCDACVEDLRTAQYRLSVAAEIPQRVPAAIAARAATQPAADQAPAAGLTAWISDARRRLTSVLRLPVLVPVAAAATLLVVFLPRLDNLERSPQDLTRAVPLRQAARVTAPSATVRADRNAGSELLANLRRGDQIVLIGEEDGWYRISLADGTEGWVERNAFE